MAIRRAVTRAQALRYRSGSRAVKSDILDTLCEVTGFHRDYARRALRTALAPRVVKPRSPGSAKYDGKVVAALEKCWAVLNAPAGKRLAPMLAELVPLLRRHRELDIDDATAALLTAISPATIDRRLVTAKSKLLLRGRSHTKPGSMLKSRIEMRTWAEHDENTPGFVEIDLVGHEGGNPRGKFCFTLTVTDIATGWTENRTVLGKAQVHVFAALTDVVEHLPFPVKGIDSDNGSEFINDQLFRYCQAKNLKFTRSRSGNKNDGAHVEQKNWTAVRQLVGYLRYDAEAELLLLNKIWVLQSLIGNHFYPQQKLISKVRHGAKVTKKYDPAQTPHARTTAHPDVKKLPKRRLAAKHASFNPAAVQRQIQALCGELLTLATAKGQPATKPAVADPTTVAVGTALADGPPHRSQPAELPHRAAASGSGGEAHLREGTHPATVAGPCPTHPGCAIVRCQHFSCDGPVHLLNQPGRPRRFCSPACRVAEHRRLR